MNRTHAPQYPLHTSRWSVPQRRRHRSVHPLPPARWPVRAVCAFAIGGVVALGVWRPPPAVDVDRLTSAQDQRVCALVGSFVDVATVGVSPPAAATSADLDATSRVNARLAQMSETLRQSVQEMGC